MDFDQETVKNLIDRYGEPRVMKAKYWIEGKTDVRNPTGLLVSILSKESNLKEDPKGAHSGESKPSPCGAFRLDGSWDPSSGMNPITRTLSSLAWMRRAGTLPPSACLQQIKDLEMEDIFSPDFLSALSSEPSWFTVKCSRSSEIFLKHAGRGRSTPAQDELDARDLSA